MKFYLYCMPLTDPRIDQYIAKAAEFARPILSHFRAVVHQTCPDVEEGIKWGFPHFGYKGSMMCSIASFKSHCAVNFWKAALMKDGHKLTQMASTEVSMGHLGRIASLKDLPKDRVLAGYIRQAMELNEKGITRAAAPKKTARPLAVPDYFLEALKANKKAHGTFEAFSTSNKREYVEWVSEAKTETTRNKRLAEAVQWMSEGKVRNWKYLARP